MTSLGFTLLLNRSFEAAIDEVTAALKTEGFGVLTEIDVSTTLKKKIGVDFPPYRILGACNPLLAHQALSLDPEVGLLLPCNVTVRQTESGATAVAIIDPLVMLGVVTNPAIQPIADEARARLQRVVDTLRQAGATEG